MVCERPIPILFGEQTQSILFATQNITTCLFKVNNIDFLKTLNLSMRFQMCIKIFIVIGFNEMIV
jgi:hypothetical protein